MELRHINQQRVRRTRANSECFKTWARSSLSPKTTRDWLLRATLQSKHEDLVLSLWANYPNLRSATEKLAEYITPYWPTDSEESLLRRSIETGASNVSGAFSQGDTYGPRVIALYLAGLASCVPDVLKVEIYGCGRNGEMEYWDYFSEPLHAWCRRHGCVEVELHRVQGILKVEEMIGLRCHLIARISSTTDTGFYEMYAPSIELS